MPPTAMASPTLGELLASTARRLADDGVADPPPTAALLASRALGISSDRLESEAGRPPTDEERARLQALIDRVAAGEPAAYVIGFAEFLGREFEVTRDTLIPRRDTEELVKVVLEQLAREPRAGRACVLELGCGSGCVAITLALELMGAEVVATDISGAALNVAVRNARRHGVAGRLAFVQGDLFEPLAHLADDRRPFDLIVSNPPYIPTGRIGAMGPAVARHEPRLALDGGADGLDFHRRILAEAPRYLAPGGLVFLEHESDEGAAAGRIGEQAAAFEDVRVLRDSRGLDRVLAARRKA